MIRRAISPRFATRTRLMVVISAPATRHVARDSERRHRLAQSGRGTRGARVRGECGFGPGVVAVERHTQRREHEIPRWNARARGAGSRDPLQSAGLPGEPRAGLRRAFEPHAHAYRTAPDKVPEPGVGVALSRELQVPHQPGTEGSIVAPGG